MAMEEALGGIRSNWSNTKNAVKKAIRKNESLSDKDRHYMYYILKADSILEKILNQKSYVLSKEFEVNQKRLNNLLCRYIRRYKGRIPYCSKVSIMLDSGMYKLENGKLSIMTLESGKRIEIGLTTKNVTNIKGNIRLKLTEKGVEVHNKVEVEVKKQRNPEKVIGIDKGYTSMIATSEGIEYGKKLGEYLSKETERRNEVNKQRNKLYARKREYEGSEDKDKQQKAKRIEENNLGKIKYNRKKYKVEEHMKNYVNRWIRQFIKEQKPTKVVLEDLTRDFKGKQNHTKKYNRKMSRWIKGYIQQRLEYICSLYGIEVISVNPAYTSQECSCCHNLGSRNFKKFSCKHCGAEMDADINAAKNILSRYKDEKIKLYMGVAEVKKILLDRVS